MKQAMKKDKITKEQYIKNMIECGLSKKQAIAIKKMYSRNKVQKLMDKLLYARIEDENPNHEFDFYKWFDKNVK